MKFRALVTVGDTTFGVTMCFATFVKGLQATIPNDMWVLDKIRFYDIPQQLVFPGAERFTMETIQRYKLLEQSAMPATSKQVYTYIAANKDKL